MARVLLLLLGCAAPAAAQCPNPAAGPDVLVSDFGAPTLLAVQAGVAAYGFGTALCNGGDRAAAWVGATAEHPISVLALYRLEDGRMEQLGMSWAHHESAALEQALCCACVPSPGSSTLGVGCSTTSSAGVVSAQSLFGPRSEVDGWSGVFAWPSGGAPVNGPLDRRLQVSVAELDPGLHPTAVYLAEVRVVAPDDANAQNRENNASWRRLSVGTPSGGAFQLTASGPVRVGEAALEAWAALDAGVLVDRGLLADDGELYLASRATPAGPGLWAYEYAISNFTSARGVRRVRVPLPPGASVVSTGFHDVDHHSGEPYDGADWAPTVGAGALEFATPAFTQDPLANALRFGTTYNVRFVCDVPPTQGGVLLEAFAPGVGPGLVLHAVTPAGELGVQGCAGQPNSTGQAGALELSGSVFASDDALAVLASDLPPQQFGYLLASQLAGFVANPGGSQGDLCVAGNIARFTQAVASSGPAGELVVLPELGSIPTNPPQAALAGETWTFQLWYRDQNPGPTSNFTEARALTFL